MRLLRNCIIYFVKQEQLLYYSTPVLAPTPLFYKAHSSCLLVFGAVLCVLFCSWSSSNGVGNLLDYQSMMILGSIKLKCWPTKMSKPWNLEMTPVDWVSRVIVSVALEPKHLIDGGSVFNLTHPNPVSSVHIHAALQKLGYQDLTTVSYSEWCNQVSKAAEDGSDEGFVALHALLTSLPGGSKYLTEMPMYDCSDLDAAISELPPTAEVPSRPAIDINLLSAWVKCNINNGM